MLLYLHGGGYVTGSPRTHRAVVARLAAHLRMPAFVPDYRLAPEHPYPAALEDTVAAYRGLLAAGFAAHRTAVAGDSSGGALALAAAMAFRDDGTPLPAVIGMFCPWLDLTLKTASRLNPIPKDPLVILDQLRQWAAAYAPANAAEPTASPLHGRFHDLPPIIVHSAGDDPLAADADRLEELAREQGASLDHTRHPGLWHGFHVLAPVMTRADRAVRQFGQQLLAHIAPPPRVAIVGAGVSGLAMAATLKRAGIGTFTVHEKATEPGGTWRDNTYPGLTCDIQARAYSFSFAPNADWKTLYASQAEIQEYLQRVTDDLGLRPYLRLGSEIEQARWDGRCWQLLTTDGRRDEAEVLVSATGFLHHPSLPGIPGLDTFAGAVFHSARWDHSVPLAGQKVAVIGNGSSGVQITTALAGVAGRLTLFQRTPQWIMPTVNFSYPSWVKAAYRRLPGLHTASYRFYQALMEDFFASALVGPGWQRQAVAALCRLHLRHGVKDPVLRRRLTPDYAPMCKRLVLSAGFFRAIGRDDVELADTGIERVEPRGVITRDGTLHEADVIVLATGFDTHAYTRPITITGTDGVTLDDAWARGPYAYRTVAVPGFPNFFMLCGPHSPVGSQAVPPIAEAQAGYVLRWIETLRHTGITAASPTPQATARYNDALRAAMPGTAWTSGCTSYYLDAHGLPELWPWMPEKHRDMLRTPVLDDFTVHGGTAPA
ncbi:alpha/beta hydrolase fold domain-containing protein [Streptomyces roseifaciens]|uniref:alpha/beta hydrolase fold domain-containing protein n=1 Tax=Streptomyces roseifaciens TaxID=1488406 RepID=UPI0013658119|nr:alpha/beta hydrolase fold domain-containing protein [Streptomyces roseifaciens]